jgi:hypothetical protein
MNALGSVTGRDRSISGSDVGTSNGGTRSGSTLIGFGAAMSSGGAVFGC